MATQYSISSENYRLSLSSVGAELTGLYWKGQEHNWIWNGESWKRHAPVLFPIVGRLKGDRYTVEGQSYELPQHGFARDMEFAVVESGSETITFKVSSSESTLTRFPYPFEFFVRYEVSDDGMSVTFQVRSSKEIFFSCGWHPAFSFPHHANLLGDMQISASNSQASYHLLGRNGLVQSTATEVSLPFPIQQNTFDKDALVFKDGLGDCVKLSSKKAGVAISMQTENAPQFGVWSKNADEFVCLEPWWGCADLENSDGELTSKFGIQRTSAGEVWQRTVRVQLSDC